MVSALAKLANHIKRTATGPMWHGPALVEALKGLGPEHAAQQPISGAHSIWEIVLHVTAWADIARARLDGQRTTDPLPDEDWPPVGGTSAAEWTAACDRLLSSHRALAEATRRLDETALDATVPGATYTVANLLHGVIEHGTYHSGQIVLLKKVVQQV
jgi:uncharacterized damage-inducible protein DinB